MFYRVMYKSSVRSGIILVSGRETINANLSENGGYSCVMFNFVI